MQVKYLGFVLKLSRFYYCTVHDKLLFLREGHTSVMHQIQSKSTRLLGIYHFMFSLADWGSMFFWVLREVREVTIYGGGSKFFPLLLRLVIIFHFWGGVTSTRGALLFGQIYKAKSVQFLFWNVQIVKMFTKKDLLVL